MAMNALTQPNPLIHRLSSEELHARWNEIGRDPLLAQIPFKVELNERGWLEVSPATARHASLQVQIASELRRLKPDGVTLTQCPIETELGVRVADVAWASTDFMTATDSSMPYTIAPEVCIEVLSRLNPRTQMLDKVTAYLAAGAREVWLVDEDGSIEIFSAEGVQAKSCLGIHIRLAS
jgi:Uma2 family endonuclease